MARDKKPGGDYEVGYCRPPVPTKWQPGQSGNPKGRASDVAFEFADSVAKALDRRIVIPVDGAMTKMRVRDALAHKLVVDAAKGKATATRELIKIMNLSEKLKAETGWHVIEARPVFQEEENRLMKLAEENREQQKRIEQLEMLLQAQGGDSSAGTRAEPPR